MSVVSLRAWKKIADILSGLTHESSKACLEWGPFVLTFYSFDIQKVITHTLI